MPVIDHSSTPPVLPVDQTTWKVLHCIEDTGGDTDIVAQALQTHPSERQLYAKDDSWFDKFRPLAMSGTDLLSAIWLPAFAGVVDVSHLSTQNAMTVLQPQQLTRRVLLGAMALIAAMPLSAQIPAPESMGLPREAPNPSELMIEPTNLLPLVVAPFKPGYVIEERIRLGGHSKSGRKSGSGTIDLPAGYLICTHRAITRSQKGDGNSWSIRAPQGSPRAYYSWTTGGGRLDGGETSSYFDVWLIGTPTGSEVTGGMGFNGRGDPAIVGDARCGDKGNSGGTDVTTTAPPPTAPSVGGGSAWAHINFTTSYEPQYCSAPGQMQRVTNTHPKREVVVVLEVTRSTSAQPATTSQETLYLRPGQTLPQCTYAGCVSVTSGCPSTTTMRPVVANFR